MSRDPWSRDLAALETAGREMLWQAAILGRQLSMPVERRRAYNIQREAAKTLRIADRMQRRYEREAAAREGKSATPFDSAEATR